MSNSPNKGISRFLITFFVAAFLLSVGQLTSAQHWIRWSQPGLDGGVTARFSSQSHQAATADGGTPVVVLSFKWTKSRKTIEKPVAATAAPAAAVTRDDINYEKSKRPIYTAGAPDPRSLSVDARSAELDRIVQESRSAGRVTLDGFEHRIKVKNAGTKVADILFWEYQFVESMNPSNVIRRQFICGVEMKPNKEKEIMAFSLSNPSSVISVESLEKSSGKPFQEQVVINRVEYTDGTIWQRKDWNFAEVKAAIARAVSTPWGAEMCRSL